LKESGDPAFIRTDVDDLVVLLPAWEVRGLMAQIDGCEREADKERRAPPSSVGLCSPAGFGKRFTIDGMKQTFKLANEQVCELQAEVPVFRENFRVDPKAEERPSDKVNNSMMNSGREMRLDERNEDCIIGFDGSPHNQV
jgi:hypothetical protein